MARSTHTSPRGFTLIEMMVVVAIIGILSAMGFAGYEAMIRTGAAQNAVHDLQALIGRARATALEKGTDVWLIVYPNIKPDGSSGGSGAYFLYEDRNSNFDGSSAELDYAEFSPPTATSPTSGNDRLLDSAYLDRDYRGAIKFGSGSTRFGAPFASSATNGLNSEPTRLDCTFCGGTGADRHGAMIFRSDGSVRFVDDEGGDAEPLTDDVAVTGRSAAIGLVSTDGLRSYLFGVSGPTGYVRVVSQ